MEEKKENAYLTCPIAGQCYSNQRRSELYKKAMKTNDPRDWSMVPMVTTLIDCFNTECLMRKDHERAMDNIKEKRRNNLINK